MSVRLNVRFALIAAVTLAVLLTGYFSLHAWQSKRNAKELLAYADRVAAEKPDRALRSLNRYLITYPDDVEARIKSARLTVEVNNSPGGKAKAVPIYERILKEHPEREDLKAEVAALLFEAQKWSDARPYLEGLANRPNATGVDIERLGRLYAAEKYWKELDQFLTAKLAAGKLPNVTDYARLAESRRQLKSDLKADEVMERLAADYPNAYETYLTRAGYKERYLKGNVDPEVEKAAKLAPDEPAVVLAVAARAISKRDPKKAIDVLEKGIVARPNEPRLHLQVAGVHSANGAPDKAVAALKRGIELNPTDGRLSLGLAQAYLDVRDWPAARKQAESLKNYKSDVIRPGDLDLIIARVDLEDGNWPEAKAKLESLRTGADANRLPSDALDSLLARCAALAGDIDQQVQYSQQAFMKYRDPAARLQYANSLLAAGRTDDAIAELRPLVLEVERPTVTAVVNLIRLLINKLDYLGPQAANEDRANLDLVLTTVASKENAKLNDAWEISILRAEYELVKANTAKAIELLAAARKKHPKEPSLWTAEAFILARSDKTADALGLIDRAEKELGDSVELRIARLRLQLPKDRDDKGGLIDRTGANIDSFSKDDQFRLWAAQSEAYEIVNKLPAASAATDKMLAVKPNDLRLWLVRFHQASRQSDDAKVGECIAALRRLDGTTGAYADYAQAYRIVHRLGGSKASTAAELETARALLLKVGSRRPNWSKALLLRGDLELQAGGTDANGKAAARDKAAAEYKEAFRYGERSPALLRELVNYYTNRRRFDMVHELIGLIRKQTVANSRQSKEFAEFYMQAPDFERAFELAREAVKGDTKDAKELVWLAQISRAAGRPVAEVEAAYRKAVELGPDDVSTWVGLVRFLVETDRKPLADATVKTIVTKVSAPEKALVILPHCYEAIGDLAAAGAAFEKALAANPADLDIIQSTVRFYRSARQPARTEPLLRGIIAGKPPAKPGEVREARRDLAIDIAAAGPGRQAEALSLLAVNEADKETDPRADGLARALVLAQTPATYGEAFRLLSEEFSRQPLPGSTLFLLARLGVATGHMPQARKAMLAILGQDKPDPEYLAFWVETLLKQGDLSNAAHYVSLMPRESADTARLTATIDARQGDTLRAKRDLLAFRPKNPADAARIAAQLEELGEFAGAEKLFRGAADSKEPVHRLAFALFLGRRSRFAEALDICDSLRQGTPPGLVETVAVNLLRDADRPPDKAIVARVEQWLSAVQFTPDRAWQKAWLTGGLAEARGEFPLAIAAHSDALKLAPGHPLVAASLARLLILTGDRSRIEEAGRLLATVAGTNPPNIEEIARLRGLVELRAGRRDEAVAFFKKLDEELPTPPGALFLSYAYREAGKPKEAQAAWTMADNRGLIRSQLHPLERDIESKLRSEFGAKER